MRTWTLSILFSAFLVAPLYGPVRKSKPSPPKPKEEVMCKMGDNFEKPCMCPRMVAQVQLKWINKCEGSSKTRKELLDCLDEMPDHCRVIGSTLWDDDEEIAGKEKLYRCKAHCKINKCKCGDSACKEPTQVPYY